MSRNRKMFRYLLILCIGFTPIVGAGGLALADHHSMGCVDCDPEHMAVSTACDSEACPSVTHACGPGFCTGFIPENNTGSSPWTIRSIIKPRGGTPFESHPTDSIFRPPIS